MQINYKDLYLMDNLIALFKIKNKRELLRVRFSEYASRYSIYEKYKPSISKPMQQVHEIVLEEQEEASENFTEENKELMKSQNLEDFNLVYGNHLDEIKLLNMN